MQKLNLVALVAVGLCLSAATQVGSQDALRSSLVTPEILETKIAEVEDAVDLSDEAKTRLVELYRRALSNLEEANANAAQASAFEEATKTAPVQTQRVRRLVRRSLGVGGSFGLGVGPGAASPWFGRRRGCRFAP